LNFEQLPLDVTIVCFTVKHQKTEVPLAEGLPPLSPGSIIGDIV